MAERNMLMRVGAWTVVVHVLVGVFFLSPGYLVPDSLGAYSFLRSLVFDHDLLFFNEWAAFSLIEDGITMFKETTRVGAVANHWSLGTSILAAPAYLLTHAVASSLGEVDGFSGLYAFTFAWVTVLSGAVASMIGILILRKRAPMWVAVLAVATSWISMPVFWYEFRFPLGTHMTGVLAVAILLAMLDTEERPSHWMAFAIGIAFGFAIVARLQHVMLGPALVWGLFHWRQPLRAYLMAGGGVVIPLLTQLLTWQAIYGNALGPLVSGASLGGETYMPFRRNALLEVLLSSYHGLFPWSPIAIVAVAGLLLYARKSLVAQIVLLMFLGEWVANGLFDRYFWGGLSFGPRRFVDLAVPLAVGTGLFIQRFRVGGTIAAVAAAGWTWALTGAAMTRHLDLAGDVMPGDLLSAVLAVPWGEMPGLIVRSAGTFRAPSFSLVSLLVVLGTSGIAGMVVMRKKLRLPVTLVYFGFWILILLFAIPSTHRDAERQMTAFGVDPALASEIGPLVDGQSLMEHERQFLVNRGRHHDAETVAREIRRSEMRVRELKELRTAPGTQDANP